MDSDPATSAALLGLVVNAWPHLPNQRRAEIIDMALTDEFRAVIAADVAARRGPAK